LAVPTDPARDSFNRARSCIQKFSKLDSGFGVPGEIGAALEQLIQALIAGPDEASRHQCALLIALDIMKFDLDRISIIIYIVDCRDEPNPVAELEF
jgi:hypothetical protein